MSFINGSNSPNEVHFRFINSTSDSVGGGKVFLWVWPVLLVVACLAFVGNGAVLLIISTVKQFRKPANYLLANLSLTAILSIIAVVSVSAQKQKPLIAYSPWICRLHHAAHSSGLVAEGFTMMQLSLDRTRIVRRPLERETKITALKKIAALWGIAIVIMLLYGIMFWNYDEKTKDFLKCSDRDQSAYGGPIPYVMFMIAFLIVVFLLPAVVMSRDLLLLTCQLRFLMTCQAEIRNPTEYEVRRRRLIRHAIIFTLLFIVFNLPIGVYVTLYRLPREILLDGIHDWLLQWRGFFFSLGILRLFFFPIIVFSLSTDIRRFCSQFCRPQLARPPRVRAV